MRYTHFSESLYQPFQKSCCAFIVLSNMSLDRVCYAYKCDMLIDSFVSSRGIFSDFYSVTPLSQPPIPSYPL